jgi:HSP20 family protein
MEQRNWLSPFGWTSQPLRRFENDPFGALQREMTRMLDDMTRGFGALPAAAAGGFAGPRIDIKENDSEFSIMAELPGVEEKDIDVTVTGDVLTIRGEKHAESTESKSENWHVMERSYGSFARAIRLPFAPRADEIQASFKDGVLRLTLPKSEAVGERGQRVRIGAGSQAQQGSQTSQKEERERKSSDAEPMRRAAE